MQTAGVRMGWEALVARGGADKQTLQMVPGPPVSVVTDSGRLRPWAQPWTKTSCALRDVCSLVTWERLALLPPPPPQPHASRHHVVTQRLPRIVALSASVPLWLVPLPH